MPEKQLVTLEEALAWSRREIGENYQAYVNPGLAGMLGLLNFDRSFVRAEGVYVWDEEGKCYLDFLGGYGALNLGHNHPEILQAVQKACGLPNLLQASLGKLPAALARNLALVTPGELKHTFFCNSGAEAVEGALKTARAASGKEKIVFCQNSFHGKTFGALSVTGREKYQRPFTPLLPGCIAVPYGDLDALEAALRRRDVAAFIVEPLQGEGGVIVPPEGYLKGARELCTKYNAFLTVDEVQTGLGRTGTLFACEAEGVVPDILCLAKSLGGGVMPLGAFVTIERIWTQAFGGMEKCLLHTSTFGGNALAAAAGISALNVTLRENLAAAAREKGNYFLRALRQLQESYPHLIKEVRGRGLLIGIEFQLPAQGIWDRLTRGTLNKLAQEYLASFVAGELLNKYQIITAYTLNNPHVIRFEPPLIVTQAQLDTVLKALEDLFRTHPSLVSLALSGVRTVVSTTLRGRKG